MAGSDLHTACWEGGGSSPLRCCLPVQGSTGVGGWAKGVCACQPEGFCLGKQTRSPFFPKRLISGSHTSCTHSLCTSLVLWSHTGLPLSGQLLVAPRTEARRASFPIEINYIEYTCPWLGLAVFIICFKVRPGQVADPDFVFAEQIQELSGMLGCCSKKSCGNLQDILAKDIMGEWGQASWYLVQSQLASPEQGQELH